MKNKLYFLYCSFLFLFLNVLTGKDLVAEAACGGTFPTNDGSIYSPNYPNNYPPNENCNYDIERYGYSHINLNVLDFHLEESYKCSQDYIEISDYYSGQTIGRYCGDYIPNFIITNSYKVRISFKSDYSSQFSGFNIYYSREGCGGTFNTMEGYIDTPNYPNDYPANMNCDYIIDHYGNYSIQLKVLSFRLEYNSGCTYDYIEISDYYSGHVIGKYCGSLSNIPENINTNSSKVRIRFLSNNYAQFSGFNIYYSREGATTTPETTTETTTRGRWTTKGTTRRKTTKARKTTAATTTHRWDTTTPSSGRGNFNTLDGHIYCIGQIIGLIATKLLFF